MSNVRVFIPAAPEPPAVDRESVLAELSSLAEDIDLTEIPWRF